MKATGVVRRIDDLGRVVIPKEIRKTLRIKEGDPLETTLEQLRIINESLHTLALQIWNKKISLCDLMDTYKKR